MSLHVYLFLFVVFILAAVGCSSAPEELKCIKIDNEVYCKLTE